MIIITIVRTSIGSFLGNLRTLSAIELGVISSKRAIELSGHEASSITEVIYGNVLGANLGQAPARQICIKSDLSETTVCTTVNKVCSSGLKAVTLGAQSIQLGISKNVLVGGCESMSNVPYYLEREAGSFGDRKLKDGIVKDGLFDGVCADQTADKYTISRAEQDEYCIQSYEKATKATNDGGFSDEIVPIHLHTKKGTLIFEKDEEVSRFKKDKIQIIKSAFTPDGTVTAANSSKLNDGAASLVLSDDPKTSSNRSVFEILGYADAETSPKLFTIAPSLAIPKLLDNCGLKISDVDYWELNEAFSVVAIVNMRLLKLDPTKVNVKGGAVSLGHPLGASGARILVTLLYHLDVNQIGCAAICNGGGGASSILVKRVS